MDNTTGAGGAFPAQGQPSAMPGTSPAAAFPLVEPGARIPLPRRKPLRIPDATEVDDGTPPSPTQLISDRPLVLAPTDPWAAAVPPDPWWQRPVLGANRGLWLLLFLVIALGATVLAVPGLLPHPSAAPPVTAAQTTAQATPGTGGVGFDGETPSATPSPVAPPLVSSSADGATDPGGAVGSPAPSSPPPNGPPIALADYRPVQVPLVGWRVTMVLRNRTAAEQSWSSVSLMVEDGLSLLAFGDVSSGLLVSDRGHVVCARPRGPAQATIAPGGQVVVEFTILSLLNGKPPKPTEPPLNSPACATAAA